MGKGSRTRARHKAERSGSERPHASVGGPAPGLVARGFTVAGSDTPGAKLSVSASAYDALVEAFGEENTGDAGEREFAAWCEANGHVYWWTGPNEIPTDGAWRLPRSERGFRTFEDPDDLDDDLVSDGSS